MTDQQPGAPPGVPPPSGPQAGIAATSPPSSPPPVDPPPAPASPGGSGGGNWLTHLLAAAIAAILAVGITIAVTPGTPSPSNPKPKSKVTVTLGGPKVTVPGEPSAHKITLNAQAQKIVTAQKAEDAAGDTAASESDLHESKAPSALADHQAQVVKPPGQPAVPEHVPLAAASQPGCTSSFVRNSSSRHGAPVELGFIHWTGSPITTTSAGALAIVHWFDTPAAQASSNYITDQSGRCYYTVPETSKAWTQAAANPWSLSVEIVNPGVLPLFRSAAAEQAVVRLMIGWHHRWKIPYQHGAVNSSCVPTRPGFLAHRDGGPCAGGHPDVGLPSAVDGLIAKAKAEDSPKPKVKPLTAGQKHACDLLNYHRRRAHKIGHWSRSRRNRADQLKRQIPAGRCLSRYRKK
jgi:hypothetical protein